MFYWVKYLNKFVKKFCLTALKLIEHFCGGRLLVAPPFQSILDPPLHTHGNVVYGPPSFIAFILFSHTNLSMIFSNGLEQFTIIYLPHTVGICYFEIQHHFKLATLCSVENSLILCLSDLGCIKKTSGVSFVKTRNSIMVKKLS